eukprot:SAG22_NODE_723_length_7636_cov_75.271726_10_plen_164_part_00
MCQDSPCFDGPSESRVRYELIDWYRWWPQSENVRKRASRGGWSRAEATGARDQDEPKTRSRPDQPAGPYLMLASGSSSGTLVSCGSRTARKGAVLDRKTVGVQQKDSALHLTDSARPSQQSVESVVSHGFPKTIPPVGEGREHSTTRKAKQQLRAVSWTHRAS